MQLILGSMVDSPSKILIKTSKAMEYIKMDIKDTKTPVTDDLIF